MKLHLPSSLRKALLACLAALAMPAFTLSVGSGSAFFGGAALISLLAAESAVAAFDPGETDWGNSTDYNTSTQPNPTITIQGSATVTVHGGNGDHLTFNTQDGLENVHFKIDITDASAYYLDGHVQVSKLWVTSSSGTGGLLMIRDSSDLSGTSDIYINNAQFWFRGAGGDLGSTNFHIGTSIRPEGGQYNGALRISRDVTTTGVLEVKEDAIINFQDNNAGVSTLSVGRITGSGALTVKSSNGSGHVLELTGLNGHAGVQLTVESGVKLKINTDGWGGFNSGAVTLNGDFEFVKGEFNCSNAQVAINAGVTAPEDANSRICIMGSGSVTFSGGYDGESSVGGLDIRNNESAAYIYRDLTVYNYGLYDNGGGEGAGTITVGDDSNHVEVTVNNKSDGSKGQFHGTLVVNDGSSLNKTGDNTQTLYGSVSGRGTLSASGGTLDIAARDGGSSVGGLATSGSGTINVNRNLELSKDGLSGTGGTVNVGNNSNVTISGYTESEFGGTLTVASGSTLTVAKSGRSVQKLSGAVSGKLVVNSGRLALVGESGAVNITGLSGEGGDFLVVGKTVTLSGGEYAGNVGVSQGGVLELSGNLTVGGFCTFDPEAEETTPSIVRGSGGTRQLVVDGGAGDMDASGVLRNVTLEDTVQLIKRGEGTQRMQAVTINGALEIEEGTLVFDGGASALNTGLNEGTGSIQVVGEGTSLALNAGGNFAGELSITGGGTVELGGNLTLNSIYADAHTGNAISGGEFTLTLHVEDGKSSLMGATSSLSIAETVSLVKTGGGVWGVGALVTRGSVTVSEGTLQYMGGDFSVNSLQMEGGKFTMASTTATAANMSHAKVDVLRVSAPENSVSWAETSRLGVQRLTVRSLTGEGNLDFGNLGTGSNSIHNEVMLQSITNYSGTLTGSSAGESKIYIGSVYQSGSMFVVRDVRQDDGYSATVDVAGGVYTNAFRKTGPGSLHINKLTVERVEGGGLWMDYQGDLTVDELVVQDGVVLHYTTGQVENQLKIKVKDLYEKDMSYGIDLLSIEDFSMLAGGVSLGIVSDDKSEDLDVLSKKLTIVGVDGVEYSLGWMAGENAYQLYMFVERFNNPENRWDPDWGAVTQVAPSRDEMSEHTVLQGDVEHMDRKTDRAQSFLTNTLVLADNEQYDGGSYGRLIRLVDGPKQAGMTTWATVLGGALYTEGEADRLTGQSSWISLNPTRDSLTGAPTVARYHLLVGGSACFTSEAASGGKIGGYVGNTHIQMEGGEVDYIVGGNHLTNTAFVFEGNSYISVFAGQVNGSVVGGSTITTGSTGVDVNEFMGETRIAIHSVLSNSGNTPVISAPADKSGHNIGCAFTAIVGGNAWVGMPDSAATGNMDPSFKGRSSILVDLVTPVDSEIVQGATTGNFDKAIVGGNYTAFSDQGVGERSTTFIKGDDISGEAAVITIRATEAAIFTAGVSGASRRASGGSGSTVFKGDTSVSIAGGTYREAVVGGFWFEETATGDHSSELTGNTLVSIEGGHVWRAVGGSYSLGGGEDSGELHSGNSTVAISGGSFSADYGNAGMSFVLGGNYYHNSAGSDYTHVDGSSGVTISGGSFDGVLVAGGDYVDTSASANCGASIAGNSFVRISAAGDEGVKLSGLVVGGSYLTDTEESGSISIDATSAAYAYATEVTIGSGAEISGEDVAAVAGSVIIDKGAAGAHSAEIVGDTHLQVTGGSVSGHLVGGSYAAESKGQNALTISGQSHIELLGGSVAGNVVGGHYSANTSSPDTLAMGGANITLDGAAVKGDIVGGHYRTTGVALPTPPTMGEVTIALTSGSIEGSVYAAGWHGSDRSSALKAETASTTVSVSSAVQFGPAAVDGVAPAAATTWVVSGGFFKAAARDDSRVSGAATLVFDSSKGTAFDNISQVAFRDFDTVSLDADVTLAQDQFRVMDRGTETLITKQGAGKLTLAGGLVAADGAAYTGRIVVDDGILALGASQALDKGIGFNLSARAQIALNDKNTAYLQAVDGAQLTAKKGTRVDLSGQNLASGFYYLTGEISGLAQGATAEDIFTWDKEHALTWDREEDAVYDLMLRDNCLVLRVHRYAPDRWIWEGDKDGVWNNDSNANWTREGVTQLTENDDVIFDAGAISTHVTVQGVVTPRNIYVNGGDYIFAAYDGSARINMPDVPEGGKIIIGTDRPELSAVLTLQVNNNRIPGVELNEGGKLIMEAASALSNSTKLWFNGGTLAYGEVPEGEDNAGNLYTKIDLSGNVQADSTGIIRLQVGRDDTAVLSSQSVIWGSEDDVRATAGTNANEGLHHILDHGLEKTGRAGLSLIWQEQAAVYTYEGSLSVLGGSLTMHAVSESANGGLTYGGTANPTIEVAEGAQLQIISSVSNVSAGVTVNKRFDIARSLVSVAAAAGDAEGPAAVIIGTDDASVQGQTNYRLSGDNSAFAGRIELRGRAGYLADSVRVKDADALGGEDTTLVLAGRNLVMEGDSGATTIRAGAVEVKEGTVNYIGYAQGEEDNLPDGSWGLAWNAGNQRVVITGALSGSGTIANSRGNSSSSSAMGRRDAYAHILSGSIADFTGTIIAGSRKSPAANKGFTGESNANFPGAYSASSWMLSGDVNDNAPDGIHASFAGLGSIIVAYDNVGAAGLLIDGRIGTDTAADGVGNTVRLENRTDGTLIIAGSNNLTEGALIFNSNKIQLGDAKHSATWTATLLRQGNYAGEGESAFVLANGSLLTPFTAENKNGVLLNVDTAANGRVRVAQTEAGVFDEIAVHNAGRLSDIKGDIIVGSGQGNTVRLVLGFDKDSVDATAGSPGDYLINNGGGNIDFSHAVPGRDIKFEFDNESFIEVLLRHRDSGAQTYLHVLTGGGEILLGDNEAAFSAYFKESASNAAILGDLGFKYMGVDTGDIIMSGSSKEVYLVLGDENEWKGDSHNVNAYNVLHLYKATVVDSGQTLTVDVPFKKNGAPKPGLDTDGLHINNLVGLENSTLHLKNASQGTYLAACEAWEKQLAQWETLSPAEKLYIARPERPAFEGDVTYVLSNALRVVSDEWALPEGIDREALKGIDTYFEGSILADEGTNIRKTGAGTLNVGMQGGSGGLTMESNYYLENGVLNLRGGELRLEGGGLALRGAGSTIGSLVFAYAEAASGPSEDRALTVSGCTLNITNSISDEAGSYVVDDAIRVEYAGELIYSGVRSSLSNLSISSDTKDGWFTVKKEKHEDIQGWVMVPEEDEEGQPRLDANGKPIMREESISVPDPRVGELTLESAVVNGAKLRVLDGELNFTAGSSIKSGEVYVQGGRMSVTEGSTMVADKLYVGGESGLVNISSTTGNSVRELSGDGTLQGAAGGELTYMGDRSSTFSGTLEGTELEVAPQADGDDAPAGPLGKGASLTINEGVGILTFQDVSTNSKAKWDITSNGNWVMSSMKGRAIEVGELTLGSTSATTFIYDPNYNIGAFHADTLSWEKDAKLTIRSSNDAALSRRSVLLGRVSSMSEEELRRSADRRDIEISLRGLPYLHYTPGDITYKYNDNEKAYDVYLDLTNIEGNGFMHTGMHKNARTGAEFFWAVTQDSTAYADIISDRESDIYKISNALADMLDDIEEGKGDRAQLDRTLAAGAGSAVAVLGSALTQDIQRQLSAIRNRTTTMGADPAYDRYNEKPLYHLWLNAESSYRKLNSDDLAPGYSLNSWGGTVGADVAFNRTTTVGVAVTAMYGDLKAESADSARGDMDTTYVSLFARKAHGAWMHTFVMSAGLADITLNRTVDYGTGSYRTSGSTDGSALGALYEIGYSKAVRADGSAIIQAVANAELRHTQINGYTERGSDAGVQVDDIEQTVITLGAGVRGQAIVGTNALNRAAILEGRVLAKYDVGDRSGTATTRLVKGAGVSGEVESAEIGIMGLELGAGINIPVGVQGTIYVDASVELRSGYTSMDANVGYRVSF